MKVLLGKSFRRVVRRGDLIWPRGAPKPPPEPEPDENPPAPEPEPQPEPA